MHQNFFTFLQAGIVTGIFGFNDEIITAEALTENPEIEISGVMISDQGKGMGEVEVIDITANTDGTFTGRIASGDENYPDVIITLSLSDTNHTTFTAENVKTLVGTLSAALTGTKIYGSIEPYSMETLDLENAAAEDTSIRSINFTGLNNQDLGIYDVVDVKKVDDTDNQYTATLESEDIGENKNITILFTVDEVTEHIAFEATYAVTA
jgi:hypothetical protein